MVGALFVPPLRFALLAASPYTAPPSSPPTTIYRGSYPQPHNLPFLSTLQLKTIVSLTPKSIQVYEEEGKGLPVKRKRADGSMSEEERVSVWCERKGVKCVHVKVDKSKDGSVTFTSATVKVVLEMLIRKEHLPIYMHDLDGSDSLALMVACLRKLQGWNEAAWVEEMSRSSRAPPPPSEHLTFVRRLLSPSPPTHATDAALFIQVPSPALRSPWLWISGLPVAKSSSAPTGRKGPQVHMNMRVRVDLGEAGEAEIERGREGKEGERGTRSRMASVVPVESKGEERGNELSDVEGATDDDDGSHEEEDSSSEDEDEVIPLSQMIDALDLGL